MNNWLYAFFVLITYIAIIVIIKLDLIEFLSGVFDTDNYFSLFSYYVLAISLIISFFFLCFWFIMAIIIFVIILIKSTNWVTDWLANFIKSKLK